MLLNYLKLSFRLMARNPFFTLISVSSLAVGFVAFIVLWQYSQSELRSDRFHKDGDRIYRALFWSTAPGMGEGNLPFFHPGIAPALIDALPDVESFCRMILQSSFEELDKPDNSANLFFSSHTQEGKRSFSEENVVYADENFFDFFTFPLLYGQKDQVLGDANSLVVSRSIAVKYFGKTDVIGETLFLNDSVPLKISGVCEEVPRNSTAQFTIVLPTKRLGNYMDRMTPLDYSTLTFYKLAEGTDLGTFSEKFNKSMKEVFGDIINRFFPSTDYHMWFMPIKDWRFFRPTARPLFYLNMLSGIAILILAMAWINHIGLEMSMNRRRLAELVTRKIVGAKGRDLLMQFLVESTVLNAIALLIGISLLQLIKKPIEIQFGFYVPDFSTQTLDFVIILGAVWILGIIVTGAYPSWSLLRRKLSNGYGKPSGPAEKQSIGHGALKVFQYACAVVLMTWVFIAYRQVNYILTKDLGIKTDDVIVVDLPAFNHNLPRHRLDAFVEELRNTAGVQDFTLSSAVTHERVYSGIVLRRSPDVPILGVNSPGGVDSQFIPFYGIELIAGRNFDDGNPADRRGIIIGEGPAKHLGFDSPEAAVGQEVFIESKESSLDKMEKVKIVGVARDYQFYPMFNGAYQTNNSHGIALSFGDSLVEYQNHRKVSLKVIADFEKTMERVGEVFAKNFDAQIFNWYFLDFKIREQYVEYKNARNQIAFFTFLAIGIATLGLLGMVSYKVVEKTKEIGIRKVLGANGRHISRLLLGTSTRQLLIAVVVGLPLAHYFGQQFSQKFTEKAPQGLLDYILPVVILAFILFTAIAWVVWKAARSNPVEALRHE